MSKLYGSLQDGPIGQQAFRLLQIYPSSDPTAEVETRLFNAYLEDPPPYEALSYRWDSSGGKQPIRINGSLGTRTFWIDQLCINQASIQDRNQQVQLMGLIYSKARLVRMWLGPELDDAEKAFELVADCAQLWDNHAIVGRVMKDEAGAKALTKLLHRSYWKRMWVFQEIVLAKLAIVHCGGQQAQWYCFSQLDKISADHELWLAAQIKHPWILDLRKALFRIAHFCIEKDQTKYINNVLHPTRHLQCQDPRDKLYALLGVCDSLADIITPDYSVLIRDVYTAFAKSQLRKDRNLSLLLTAGLWNPSNGEDIQLPTWVPDLRGMGGVDIRYLAGSFIKCFEADDTATIPVKIREKDGYSILNVEAMLIDSVQTYQDLDSSTNNDERRKELISDFCLAGDVKKSSMAKLRYYFQAMIFENSTFFGHQSNKDPNAKKRLERLILGFFEELQRFFGPEPVFNRFLRSFEDVGIELTKGESMEVISLESPVECHMEYLSRARETIRDQVSTLYTTLHGRIGIGTRSVNQDDDVAVVRGCRVPLLLRRHETYYRLVGPSYIAGLMEKEGVALAAEGSKRRLEYESIKLI